MKKKMLLSIVAVMVVGVFASGALAGGFFGIPGATVPQGEWAIDVGYWHEDMDLHGCALGTWTWRGASFDTDANDYVWGDWSDPDYSQDSIALMNFKTNTWLASFEYGVCDNWTWYVRAGMADAEADITHSEWESEYDEDEEEWVYGWEVDTFPASFGYGFAWQIGTSWTICEIGPVIFGGRAQVGAMYLDGDSWSDTEVYDEDPNEFEISRFDADFSSWQAVCLIGGVYPVNDAFSMYAAGGWQTMEGCLDLTNTSSEYDDRVEDGEQALDEERWSASYRTRHESVIGLFGACYRPNDNTRVSGEVLVGEAGKIGFGLSGQFMVP